ncbi:oocyte zinc finger protein XlCOF8.4-like [Hyperolius riggenbachi]|uniref:oocyte zinc finger protein XlCOF8.4-like n=1 Tax=Hyperolius riggenbachi TaxID=752182 RepID=UPI0035A2FB52
MRMKEYQGHMTERILNLTLEIICLVTGESLLPVSCGDHVTFMVPLSHSLTLERSSEKKILKVIHKMIELLTGEVPIRYHDISVYFSMEEWQYLKGHKDLYKDDKMEDQSPLSSPAGPSTRNPAERYTGPLYSQDCTQEDHTIPQHYQEEILNNVKEEDIPGDQKTYSVDDWPHSREYNTTESGPGSAAVEEPLDGLLSLIPKYDIKDCTTTQGYPGENLFSPNIRSGHSYVTPPKSDPEGLCQPVLDQQKEAFQTHNIVSVSDHGQEISKNNRGKSSREKTFSPEIHQGVPCMPPGTFHPEGSYHSDMNQHTGAIQTDSNISLSKYGPVFAQYSPLTLSGKDDTELKNVLRTGSNECLRWEAQNITNSGTSPAARLYSCPECGECFFWESELVRHQRSHSQEMPYSCPECGKCFMGKRGLHRHYKSHAVEKPHQCSECGKGFMWKSELLQHSRVHTGEKPFSCLECGKSFTRKAVLLKHRVAHTGRKSISCLVCGECFTWKSDLDKHQRKAHTGERTLSCIDCGKRYTSRSHLLDHQRTHTGEKPFSCPECKRCFTSIAQLNKHCRAHTSELSMHRVQEVAFRGVRANETLQGPHI